MSRKKTRSITGRNYPILVCMICGGNLKKAKGGYVCRECGELHLMEEAGLEGALITNIEDEENGQDDDLAR